MEQLLEIPYTDLRDRVCQELELAPFLTDEQLKDFIDQCIFDSPICYDLHTEQKLKIASRLFHSFRGLDILQPLIDDPRVTEIMINGPNQIFIEKGGITERISLSFESTEKLEDLIQIMVGKVNRAVNDAQPIVDARLQNGSRVNVVLPPIALNGPTVTIRKFPDNPYTLSELVIKGTISSEASIMLENLVKAKYNIFIGGGTGSGKTTLLNALSQCIPTNERVITIEDSAELKIRGVKNLVSMETRNANTEGKGKIAISDLIRTSLRMRPNRIIVGEVRGAEAYDMLQAMNTGHDGSLSTGHANSVIDMLHRLETMVLSGVQLPLEAIRRQICSAIDIMVHLSRFRDGSRRVTEISEITEMSNGEIRLNPLYVYVHHSGDELQGSLSNSGNPIIKMEKWIRSGLA
ncbi:MAG: ATPase, T2SS/T4P/T4SS family [Paenibacillaceae bacterium]